MTGIAGIISFIYGFFSLFTGKKSDQSPYYFIGGGILLYFFNDIKNFFNSQKTTDPGESQEIPDKTGSNKPPVSFDLWRPFDYSKLVTAGYVVTAHDWSFWMDQVYNLLDKTIKLGSTVIVDDSLVLGIIRKANSKADFNKLVSASASTDNWIANTGDFHTFLKNGTSSETFQEIKEYITKLPDGWR